MNPVEQLTKFFSPCIDLKLVRTPAAGERFAADLLSDRAVLIQLIREAGVAHKDYYSSFAPEDYNKVLAAAGKHGISLSTTIEE